VLFSSVRAMELQLYSCEVGKDFWETAWTPDWKAWCCLQHPPLGCPETSTITETSSTATTTTATTTATKTSSSSTWTWTSTTTATQNSCDLTCDYGQKSATCGDRIQFASGSSTASRPDLVQAAQELVASQCDICSACTPDAFRSQYGLIVRKFETSDGVLRKGRASSQVSFAKLCSSIASMLLVGGFVLAGIRRRRNHVDVDIRQFVEE